MPNFDENVSLEQGSDTGQADTASIQPIAPAEVIWEGVTNRPLENLRARTEILRRYVQSVLYYLDYDRQLLLRSNAVFKLTEPTPGNYVLAMVGDDLWVYPTLTPGRNSGGRVRGGRVFVAGLPYSGTPLVNDLILTASAQYTGQRGYFDGDDFASVNSLTLGANRIRVDLVADPALATNVVQFAFTEAPKTKITIRYGTNGGATSLAALIAAINADLTSQGTYGVANFLRASTTAGTPAAVYPSPFTGGVVQGAYDAEAHQVTDAQLAAFFAATESGIQVNQLQEGEALAIGYPKGPVEAGVPTPRGGRRQSLWDLPVDRLGGVSTNTTPLVGWSLFSTGREPEKIPGAVPIGKIINGEFVFVDGTRLGVGESLRLGESRTTLAALASTVFGSAGAALIGFDGSGLWNADAAASANPTVPAGTLDAALDAIVAHLAAVAATNSGARRVGIESFSGAFSAGNRALSPTQGSVREALDAALNAIPTSTTGGGVNFRVNEDGHELKGVNPLNKDFTALSQGARRFGALLKPSGNLTGFARPGALNYADLVLTPIEFSGGSGLNLNEPVTSGSTNARLRLNAGDIAGRFGNIWPQLPTMISQNVFIPADEELIPLIFVRVQGLVSPTGDENGVYIFDRFFSDAGPTLGEFILRQLDFSLADFTAVTDYSSATVDFCAGQYIGGTRSNTQFAHHQLPGLYPGIVVGCAANDTPWLEVLTRSTPGFTPGVGQAVRKGTILYADRARWRPGLADERDTLNILTTADKALLDGVETGAPVDATANHHHGATYSLTRFRSSTYAYPVITDMSVGAPWFFSTPADQPPGYSKIGLIINYVASFLIAPGAPGTALIDATLDFAGSLDFLTYYSAPARIQMTKDAAGTTTLIMEGQVMVRNYLALEFPMPFPSGFRVQLRGGSAGAAVNLTGSTLSIFEVGYILTRV